MSPASTPATPTSTAATTPPAVPAALPFPPCFLYAPFTGPAAELHLLPPHAHDHAFALQHFRVQFRRPRAPEVLGIRYMVNPALWAAHAAFEDAVVARRGRAGANIAWGFHGTHRGHISAIASRGMRREVTVKTAYGYG